MSKNTRTDNLAQDDDLLDDGSEWIEEALDSGVQQDKVKPAAQRGPKWQAIEDYWERKRLQDALRDCLTDED